MVIGFPYDDGWRMRMRIPYFGIMGTPVGYPRMEHEGNGGDG
jgi:hypothetical protein